MSGEENGVSLEEILVYVERALKGDRQLRSQLFTEFQQLANHPDAPAEERALGMALARILVGNFEPDLSGLAPEAAEEMKTFLDNRKREA